MTDYNWKSCADPANAARLRELLEAERVVMIVREADVVRFTYDAARWLKQLNDSAFAEWQFLDPDEPAQMRHHTCECVCGCTERTNDDLCADCHVRDIRGNGCQTMRARIAELEAENQRLTDIARHESEHLANYRRQLKDRDEMIATAKQ